MHQPSTRFTPNPSMSLPVMRSSRPAPLSAAALPSFDPDTLDPQASLNRLEQIIGFLDNSLRLPDNARTFSIYLGALMVIFAGAFMHVLMAAQIMQARYELERLEQEYLTIERENGELIFMISRELNLARLYSEAVALGYIAPQTREFVFVDTPLAAAPDLAAPELTTLDLAISAAPAPTPLPAAPQVQPAADMAPLQSWREFWVRMWMPATAPGQPLAAQFTPAQSAPEAMPSLMPETMRDADEVFAIWWQQTTTRAEAVVKQLLGN